MLMEIKLVSQLDIAWIVIALSVLDTFCLFYVVWRWMRVNDHLSASLESDVSAVDLAGEVTFSGVVTDIEGLPKEGVAGVLNITDPAEANSTIPFTTDVDGKFSIVWSATKPAGVWSFFADIEGVDSNPLTITQRTATRVTPIASRVP
jgi:hypothetical protein